MRNVIKRIDYTPPTYWIEKVDLTFELNPQKTQVSNTMKIVRNSNLPSAPLILNGENLILIQITLDGQLLGEDRYQMDKHSLTIANLPEQFELSITTLIHPDRNTELEGLYISNDIFCTQCEAHGFRRITYFLDRPDVMTLFTTKIIADKQRYPQLLSNGNLIETG
ncbi:MAG: aminopeptidase N, partial [Gammaproteobacteria bacterium]